MKHIIDPELIVLASPNYDYGKSLGLTDEECERSTLETMDAMKKAYDKTLPVKPDYEADGYDDSGNLLYDTWICPNCEKRYEMDYEQYEHCPNCGQAIDWEVSP